MTHITDLKSWAEGRKEKEGPAGRAEPPDKKMEARAKATQEALSAWREEKARARKKPWWKFWC